MFNKLRQSLALCLLALVSLATQAFAAPAFTWVEGEAPTSVSPASFKPEITDVGQPAYLSGGKWLHVSIDGKDVPKTVPTEGLVLTYKFASPAAAPCEVWNRIGYEAARSPFDWRLDGGTWTTIAANAQTIDMQQLQTWNPVAWLKLTTQPLTAGDHTLEIRLLPTKNGKGEVQSINYALDAVCVSAGPFHPNDKYQPGDTGWISEEDKAASAQVFSVPAPAGAAQTPVSLKGLWQIARWDEGPVTDPSAPIAEAPSADSLFWKSMVVPGNRDAARPEWLYNHRYFLRTRVNVPADLAGHSFFLHFPGVDMLGSVFVNGQLCGTTKAPLAVWDCDITKAVKPGGVNEVWVGIKDWFYAIPLAKGSDGAQYVSYLPADWVTKFGPASFTFPVWNHEANGIVREPSLVVAGKAYTSDVFALPSVKNKALGLEVSVTNPTTQPVTVTVENSVVPLAGGAAEKKFAPQDVTIPAGQTTVVKLSEAWANPKLWWPDSPSQYNVVTTLSAGGQPLDRRQTKFGFREWDWHGPQFTLNGVPFHGHADLSHYNEATEAAVAAWHKHGQTMERMWTEDLTSGFDVDAALDFYDAHGIPIRRTGIFDGEAVKYNLGTSGLLDNWRDTARSLGEGPAQPPQHLHLVPGKRDHVHQRPCHRAGRSDDAGNEESLGCGVVCRPDPTRHDRRRQCPLDESLPVYGGHYMQPGLDTLPEGAYGGRAAFAHRQVWPITQPKPILFGEDFFASGVDVADLATIGGEAAFVGKAESHPAGGLGAKMLSEGYRWDGINFHFWFGGESDLHYNSWQPIAVLCRQWDSSFLSGQKVTRTLGIFNDTHETQPITMTWTLTVGGKKAASQTSLHKVAAGMNEKFDVIVPMPTVASRQEGTWTLALSVGGKPVFQDVRPISVLSPAFKSARLFHRRSFSSVIAAVASGGVPGVAVYDPYGSASSFLTNEGVSFTKIGSLREAPAGAKVLIIGKDALTPAQSTSSLLAAYASAGRTVIVLEQKNPLKFQALPGAMTPDTNVGSIAFIEDLDNPVLRGLQQRDFFGWGGDGLVYRNAYQKPTSGGKSLVQCHDRLQDTALAQMSAGKGLVLVSQLLIGQKLTVSPIAQQLLLNMISFGEGYRQISHPVTTVAGDNTQLIKALDAVGLNYGKADDPLAALSKSGTIAVVNASPANLRALASSPAKVSAFTQGGGWIVFNNLTPDGLADYNKIVGVNHLIRPYGREKVAFPIVRNPLMAGLATSNIVLGSGQQIFPLGRRPVSRHGCLQLCGGL